jgi:hypothetical protein
MLILNLGACKNATEQDNRKDGFTPVLKTRQDSLYHEVMQGHDVGMAKMSTLRKYQRQAKAQLDSMSTIPRGKLNEQYNRAIRDLLEELNYADHAMFKWMEEFKVDSAEDDEKKRLAYLESEKPKVEMVRDNILNSLRRADSLLGSEGR